MLKNAFALTVLVLTMTGCSSNLSRFDVINVFGKTGTPQITRAETADQGSGDSASAFGPGGHTLSRVTVGGYYLRRTDSRVPAGTSAVAGLHGNPRAKQ